ncbi:MAG: hypothetical protein K0S79_119 [Nitrospira sp.]|jgi:hypothetical protein|nr:hypothetical protein [Nitrospira sp.]
MKDQFPARLVVEVTQADIDEGIRRDCLRCPIAIATYRALDGDNRPYMTYVSVADRVEVTSDETSDGKAPGVLASYRLPNEANRFINYFDTLGLGHLCKPSTFDLVRIH